MYQLQFIVLLKNVNVIIYIEKYTQKSYLNKMFMLSHFCFQTIKFFQVNNIYIHLFLFLVKLKNLTCKPMQRLKSGH